MGKIHRVHGPIGRVNFLKMFNNFLKGLEMGFLVLDMLYFAEALLTSDVCSWVCVELKVDYVEVISLRNFLLTYIELL